MRTLRDAVATLALQEQWTLDELQQQRLPVEERLQASRAHHAAQENALASTGEQLSRLLQARTFNPALAELARRQWARQAHGTREAAGQLEQLESEASTLHASAVAAQHRLRLLEDEAERLRRQEAKVRETTEATVVDDLWLQQHWGQQHGV